jgi:hypothetical protein
LITENIPKIEYERKKKMIWEGYYFCYT